jgi:hypothetical protein
VQAGPSYQNQLSTMAIEAPHHSLHVGRAPIYNKDVVRLG